MKRRWVWLLAPLPLIAGCEPNASGTAGEAGRVVLRQEAARAAAEAAAEANREGAEVVMRSGQRELRAPVEAVKADAAVVRSIYSLCEYTAGHS